LALFCVAGVPPARAEGILPSIGFVFHPIRVSNPETNKIGFVFSKRFVL
jgi:hypothetical protein